ncbi:MAG: insulinase family protein, partial [Candidatus Omnitrophica bacterium]|nr:insulinase family protein [Candidatus Omnitrophota bacterium]
SRDHIKEFYAQLSAAANMVISVVGDIDPQKTLETIRKKFGKIPAKDIKSAFFTEKDVQGPIVKEETMDKEQAIVMFGFHGVALDNPDRYPLEVLTEILGSSFSGRFFVNIREKYGDAYTMGAVHVPGPDLGFIYMYVLTKPGSADKVKMLMEEEIADLQNVPVSDEELDTMKVYLKGRAKASLEKSSSVAFTTSLDELYGLGYDYYKQYDALIDAVTKEDVQAAAQKYLDLTKSVAVITRPPSKESTP